jgi:hypothetical protein
VTQKIANPAAGRKSPPKATPLQWKHGVASLAKALKDSRLWAGHREKRPVTAKTSRPAKSNDPKTWSTWAEVAAYYERTQHDLKTGAGLMMSRTEGVVALDLDHCMGKDGLPLPWAQPILARFVGKTYVEVSFSGNGAHVVFVGYKLPEGVLRSKATLKVEGGAVEFFAERHFITLSANVYLGSEKVSACQEELDLYLKESGLLSKLAQEHEAPVGPIESPEVLRAELATASLALQAIDPDCDRETWLQTGMAMKAAFGAAGWAPWYEWSRGGGKFVSGDCEKVWQSFLGTGVGLGSLYHHAKAAGWDGRSGTPTRERTSAQEDFAEVEVPRAQAKPGKPTTGLESEPDPVAEAGDDGEGEVEVYEHGTAEDWQAVGLHLSVRGSGKNMTTYPSEGEANIGLYLERHSEWKERLRYNERTMEVEVDGEQAALDLHRLSRQVLWFMGWKRSPSENAILNAALAVGKVRRYDPVKEHLKSLRWDGTARLDELCAKAGLETTPLAVRMLRRWCIGAVARAFQPGVEMQNMLVLHGGQGAGKSTLFKKLAMRQDWYTESKVEIGTKDGQLALVRSWIVEMGELSTMAKAQVEETKGFISQSHAEFRPPYGRKTESFPRRCVLGGTTNDDEWMRDGTGSRRFWLVAMEDIGAAHKLTPEWVEQAWAEAVVAYKAGERWWDEGEEVVEVTEKNKEHYQTGGLDALVEVVLANVKTLGVTSDYVLRELVANHRVNPGLPRKVVAQAMERQGWKASRIRPLGKHGPQPWIYRRPGVVDPAKDPKVREALVLAFKAAGPAADFEEVPVVGEAPVEPHEG